MTAAWLATGFLVAAAVAVPLCGRLGDVVGKKRMVLVSLGLFAVGSLVCAVVDLGRLSGLPHYRGAPVFEREVIAPDGRVWTVRRRWPPWRVLAGRQGAYHYVGDISSRESRRELERITRAIESGELDATLADTDQSRNVGGRQ